MCILQRLPCITSYNQVDYVLITGQQTRIRHLSLSDLMPPTEDYMTYEGSMTQPGCHETITWIVMNKPVYVTVEQVR